MLTGIFYFLQSWLKYIVIVMPTYIFAARYSLGDLGTKCWVFWPILTPFPRTNMKNKATHEIEYMPNLYIDKSDVRPWYRKPMFGKQTKRYFSLIRGAWREQEHLCLGIRNRTKDVLPFFGFERERRCNANIINIRIELMRPKRIHWQALLHRTKGKRGIKNQISQSSKHVSG